MIAILEETQRSHAPREFVVSGKPRQIPERPERIDIFLAAVQALGGPARASVATAGHGAGLPLCGLAR